MELNNIKSSNLNWGDAANDLNQNFGKINNAIEQVKNVTTRNKGYFSSSDKLLEAYPSAHEGDIAYVKRSGYTPFERWRWNGAAWEGTGESGGNDNVSLGDYYTQEEIDGKFTNQDEKLSELGSKVGIVDLNIEEIEEILSIETSTTKIVQGSSSVEDSSQYVKYFYVEYQDYILSEKVVVTYCSNADVEITPMIFGTGAAIIKTLEPIFLKANNPVQIVMYYDGEQQTGYGFGGSSYKQSAFDVDITISKSNKKSKAIKDINADIHKAVGKNLLNVYDRINGVHFNGLNIVGASDYSTSNYIEVEDNCWYNLHGAEVGNYIGILFFSDKDEKKNIGGAVMYSQFGNAMSFKTLNGTKYIRVGFGKKSIEDVENLQLEKGYCSSELEKHEQIQYYSREPLFSINLFNGMIEGYSVNLSNYYVWVRDGYVISKPISVEAGKIYYIKSSRKDFIVAGSTWDKQGGFNLGATSNGSLSITIPSNVNYIFIGNISMNDNFVVSEFPVNSLLIPYAPIPERVYNAISVLFSEQNETHYDIFDKSKISIQQYGIANNGYEYSAETRIAKIPIKPSTIYTWFNGVVSTEFVPLAFRCSDGNLRLGDGCLVSPSAEELDFSTPSTMATYYTERVYFKTSSTAEYVEIKITDAMLEADEMHLYEGILYQNPAVCKEFNNAKINALVIGDSYWDRQGADYYGNSIANQLRELLGINYVMNFAQGGGRLIHTDETKDVTSYSESYANGSAMNVYSNQFLKYKFRHEEEPSKYPLPDMVIIGGVLNNSGLFDKFDEENFASVFNEASNVMDEKMFSGAFKRLITLIYSVVGDIPIVFVGSSATKSQTYIVTEMERIHDISCRCFGIRFISYMQEGMKFYNTNDYTDGVHPTEASAKKIARCIAKKIKE